MTESFIDPAWRERDHNSISATIIGGTHQDLSTLCDSLSTQSSVSLLAFDTPQELQANIPAKPLTLAVAGVLESAQKAHEFLCRPTG